MKKSIPKEGSHTSVPTVSISALTNKRLLAIRRNLSSIGITGTVGISPKSICANCGSSEFKSDDKDIWCAKCGFVVAHAPQYVNSPNKPAINTTHLSRRWNKNRRMSALQEKILETMIRKMVPVDSYELVQATGSVRSTLSESLLVLECRGVIESGPKKSRRKTWRLTIDENLPRYIKKPWEYFGTSVCELTKAMELRKVWQEGLKDVHGHRALLR